jgi:hypothetical protein
VRAFKWYLFDPAKYALIAFANDEKDFGVHFEHATVLILKATHSLQRSSSEYGELFAHHFITLL